MTRRTPTSLRPEQPESTLWHELARCRTASQAVKKLFYAPLREIKTQRRIRENKAKEFCSTCPVKGECLNYAVEHGITTGIWGGVREETLRSMVHNSRQPQRRLGNG